MERMSLKTSSDHDPRESRTKTSKHDVAESWDAESLSSSDTETETPNLSHFNKRNDENWAIPNAPPPTPISPSSRFSTGFPDWGTNASLSSRPQLSLARDPDEERRRPEKSTAVAGRLIAGALGVKPPKKTEEQRKYERAVKEQEIKRKNKEKGVKEKEKEDEERAKASVWDR